MKFRAKHIATSGLIGLSLALILLQGLAAGRLGFAAAAPTEYQLKAAFLLNFAKFVDWPGGAFKSPQSPIFVCVAGDDPFGRDIEEVFNGQNVNGRPLSVRRLPQPQKDDCHIVFIGRTERDKFDRMLSITKNLPCLTVGEEDEFAQAGGMINLSVENNRIRFDVNLDAADRVGLKISSRLLKLAKNVRSSKKN